MNWKPDITIIGAGGMGALFGAILHDGGLNVTLVDTDRAHVDAINNRGLKISGYGGDRTRHIPATTSIASVSASDVVFFQCKSYASRSAAQTVKHLVDQGAVAVSFQNGLGNEAVLAEVLGEEKVLGGLTSMAGYMTGPGQIRDFSRTPSYIGEMQGGNSERAERIAAALSHAGLEVHVSSDIIAAIWKKLLGNIAMSAISGITNLTSAQALQVSGLKTISHRALDEALMVAASQNIGLEREEVLQGFAMITKPGGTGDNKSSLCVDILNQRPTEVDFIYGTVIDLGRKAGIATPTLDTLAAIIKGIESRYMKIPG